MATKDSKLLVWHETSPGHYERGIDEGEFFYTSLAKRWEGTGRTYFAMTSCVEISVQHQERNDGSQIERRVETALRKAWRRLRYDHPTLASAVEYDASSQTCKKVYETFVDDEDGAKEADWLDKSFIIIRNGQSGTGFCNSDPPVNKYATLYLITPPSPTEDFEQKILRRDVVFRCHHDVIDGIGTLMLLNNLFQYASRAYSLHDDYTDIRFGDEFRNLSPPFRVAARIPSEPTEAQKDRARIIMAENAAAAKDAEIIGIPFHLGKGIPAISQRTAIYLSEEETRTILQKCRAARVSATQAFHAGIVIAVRDIQDRKEAARQARYVNYCLINLRSFCDPPYNTSQHAASVYHSGSGRSLIVDVTIPAESRPPRNPSTKAARDDFIAVVTRIRAFYTAVRSDREHIAMVPLYYAAITPSYPTSSSPPADVPPPNLRPSVSISGLGVIDEIVEPRHGPFRLENPWVAADEYSTGVGVFLATWKGRMCLSAGYNEAYHGEGQVLGFLERVREVVDFGLGGG